MNIEMIREYCLSKAYTSEGFPFDEQTLVFYVAEKMFGLIGLDDEALKINLKCDPEKAIDLREKYEAIQPGYHMSKKHWNTVHCDELNSSLVLSLIDHSYEMVVKGFTKKKRSELGLNPEN